MGGDKGLIVMESTLQSVSKALREQIIKQKVISKEINGIKRDLRRIMEDLLDFETEFGCGHSNYTPPKGDTPSYIG